MDCVTAKASELSACHQEEAAPDETNTFRHTRHGSSVVMPFDLSHPTNQKSAGVEASLSRVVSLIHTALIQSANKNSAVCYI